MKEIKCIVYGKVQMVMFRDFVVRSANKLGIVGAVRNINNGTVEVIAQGDDVSLTTLIKRLHKGSFLSHVVRVVVVWREPTEVFTQFNLNK